MANMYIDEKGPQETFKISEPFVLEEKIAYGTDKIHGYIGDIWYIADENIATFNEEYEKLEKDYLNTLQNPNIELKGQKLLKGRFEYGVSSMRGKDIKFYTKLLNLLIESESFNLLFSVNKMSVIVDAKLLEWFYIIDEKRLYHNIFILKYVITKYMNIEASKNVICTLFDSNQKVKDLLNEIQKDMTDIISKNKRNKRMEVQVQQYKEIIKLIKNSKHYTNYEPSEIKFDWKKVTYSLDLWLTEHKLNFDERADCIKLFLDEGISSSYFQNLGLKEIHENCKSNELIGLRIADFLVVLAGNYIKGLSKDSQYDRNQPEKVKRLSKKWFDFNSDAFSLIKLMNTVYFTGGQYCFVVDTYFDEEIGFEVFVEYISSYSDYSSFKKISSDQHVKKYWEMTSVYMKERWYKQLEVNKGIRDNFGSIRTVIEDGLLKPI